MFLCVHNFTPRRILERKSRLTHRDLCFDSINDGKEVIILWDLDNVNPGTTCERFAINAQRIKKAGEKFGKVVSFKAFAGTQTSRDLSECCTSKGFKEIFEKLNLKTEFNLVFRVYYRFLFRSVLIFELRNPS